ncbi:hypothetical protein AMTRI_Chr04g184450 [Amborella trichopoda]
MMERFSFGSDTAADHECIFLDLINPKHLAGFDGQAYFSSSRGPDPLHAVLLQKNLHATTTSTTAAAAAGDMSPPTIEKAKAGQILENSYLKVTHDLLLPDFESKRLKAETQRRRHERIRPASLDLNDQVEVLGAMTSLHPHHHQKGSSHAPRRTANNWPSPGTPISRHPAPNKGWSSERVPLNHGRQRYIGLPPGPTNGRGGLPSKWEDAEKWIFSPVTLVGGADVSSSTYRNSALAPPPRRPKSKSGPLAVVGPYSSSPMGPVNKAVELGVINAVEEGPQNTTLVGFQGYQVQPCIVRSASVHGWSDLMNQATAQSSSQGTDEKPWSNSKDASSMCMISPGVSRRDVATQMSPGGSTISSPTKRRASLSSLSSNSSCSALVVAELQQPPRLSKSETLRDVQVDEEWQSKSGEGGARASSWLSVGADREWKKKALEVQASVWEVSETAKCMSRSKREEAKISAWENLQRAKAEAEIRKLEMKLEKMRSSSMEKIMKKLQSAQRKAQKMRISISSTKAQKAAKTTQKTTTIRRTPQIASLSGCFTCHASP